MNSKFIDHFGRVVKTSYEKESGVANFVRTQFLYFLSLRL